MKKIYGLGPDGKRGVLYDCDPEKNRDCRKSNCKIHGGPCGSTDKREMRLDGSKPFYTVAIITGKGKFVMKKEYFEEGEV